MTVLRNVLAAIVGYVVLVVVVMAGIGLAWAILGGAGAFAGEGPYPSATWLTWNLVTGFLGAAAGGWVALRVGRSRQAVYALIGLVIVLGLVSALTAERQYESREPVDKAVAEMTFREAGQHARHPNWYNWVIPIVGVAGVCLGGRQRRSRES